MTNASASTAPIPWDSYEVVAAARGQTPVYFRQFGSYQGEWILVSHASGIYFIYKDYYGSCSGCDALQSENIDGDADLTSAKVQEFIAAYPPFAELPNDVAVLLSMQGSLLEAFPANIREDIAEGGLADAVAQVQLLIKSREGVIKAREILDIRNAEQRREATERYGPAEMMNDLGGDVIDQDGDNLLITLSREGTDPFVFANVKDSSTPRRYLIRVPPTMRRVREALAWTFQLTEAEYVLEQES